MEPQKVDVSNFYIRRNATDHNTIKYDLVKDGKDQQPVFRRGEDFDLTIGAFKRDFNEDTDKVRLVFSFGSNGAQVVCLVRKRKDNSENRVAWPNPLQWDAVLVRNDRTYIIIRVHIPPETFVGLWKCKILTNTVGHVKDSVEYTVPHDIYILFNPWNSQDPVYLENEKEREEYINTEYGKIFTGTAKQPAGKHWIYGQFDKVVLPVAILLLEKSKLGHNKRDSPVHVARAISAVINAVDEGGLLEGRWDGNYEDGVSPHVWTGTLPILEQYLESGATPVKYGQCWVYSAATVTICRALGIPCRSVTIYVSAHDTNESLTVDKYFDIFGDKITNGPIGNQSETCWNFHVWNEVWMRRSDLSKDHSLDGWQVIDATPQERSDGIMRCGPASVAAVRKGEVGYQYDTPFVFAAINADVIHYKEDPESELGFRRLSINKNHVGRRIITKKIGSTDDYGDSDLWDITDVYKSPEGSEAERLAVYNAIRGVRRTRDLYKIEQEQNEDVFFELVDIDTVPIGSSFDVEVRFQNRSNSIRTIRVYLSASAVYYKGNLGETIQKGQDTFKVKPGQKDTLRITVSPYVYIDKLVEHNLIQIFAVADVEETKQIWSDEDDFTFSSARIAITVPGVAQVDEKFEVNFSFRNPLDRSLTECYYFVGGPGHKKTRSVKYVDVQPRELVYLTESFVAKKRGKKKIAINFTSKQIQNIGGSTSIIVE